MDKSHIYICTHNAKVATENSMFLPIQVGKGISGVDLGILSDDEGDNISDKNPHYCELTALYWIWKNADISNMKYIGLCHYRRYFNFKRKSSGSVSSLENYFDNNREVRDDVDDILSSYDIILSRPMRLSQSLSIHYSINHISEDYNTLKSVIAELYPMYLDSFVRVMENNNKISYYNMFISNATFVNEYSEWLFGVLKEVESRVNISGYNKQQSRIFGFMGERLLNVYVEHHKMRIKYLPITNIGMPNKHDGIKFHMAKLWANIVFYVNAIDKKLRQSYNVYNF